MPSFVFDGLDCHYAAEGIDAAGLPLLLIHGVGGNLLHWPPRLRRLAGRPVYALDLPGHGRSPGPGLARIDDFVRLIALWVEAIGVDTFALGGHSLGSAVALSYALAQPQRVQALWLVGAGPRLRVHPALLEQLQSDPAAAAARIVQLSYGPSVEAARRDILLRHLRTVDPSVLYAGFVACNDFDATARLGEVNCPTLMLAGADDRMTPPSLAQELHAGIAASSLRILPATGHMIPIERPQATTDSCAAFLADQSV